MMTPEPKRDFSGLRRVFRHFKKPSVRALEKLEII